MTTSSNGSASLGDAELVPPATLGPALSVKTKPSGENIGALEALVVRESRLETLRATPVDGEIYFLYESGWP